MVISCCFDCIILVCNLSARVDCSSCIYWISIHLTGVCFTVPCKAWGKSHCKLITFVFYLVPDSNLTQSLLPCKSVNCRSITLKLFASAQDQDKALVFMLKALEFFPFSSLHSHFSGLEIPGLFSQDQCDISREATLIYTY